MFKGEHIDQLVELAKSIVSDLESHISKIPIYVFYLIKQIKRKIKKELVSRKSDKKEFEKLKQTLFRLLFKNIISRLLKILGSENQDFLMKTLGYSEKSETKKRIEYYFLILEHIYLYLENYLIG